jgi:hypothetical protein
MTTSIWQQLTLITNDRHTKLLPPLRRMMMPLLPGKQNIGRNIKEMEATGRPYRVARAAALRTAYGKPKKKAKKKPKKKAKKSPKK